MRRTCLFGWLFCAFLVISCNDDKEENPWIKGEPKEDIEFEGATLSTVMEALQGTWWVSTNGGVKYKEGDLWYMTIKDNKIIQFGGALVDYASNPEWKDIIWSETRTRDGKTFISFTPEYDNPEYTDPLFSVPVSIKDNILIMGYNNGNEIVPTIHYSLSMK